MTQTVAVAALVLAAWYLHRRTVVTKEYATVAADIGTVAPTVIASGAVNPVTTIQVGTYVYISWQDLSLTLSISSDV